MSDFLGKRPYDHGRKAGNEGDVTKHAVLARIVEHLASPSRSQPFNYAESHAGRARYVLEGGKEWENGIKIFSSSKVLREAIESWRQDDATAHKLTNLRPYAQNCCLEPIKAGMAYLGSSRLVSRILWRNSLTFRFHLWDIDVDVIDDLLRDYPQWAEITVSRGDGLRGVQELKIPSFVFIDPFSLENDKEAVLEALGTLDEIPFMCWTPLVGSQDNPVTANFRSVAESRDYAVAQVAWSEKCEDCWGCQITASHEFKSLLEETIAHLLVVMDRWWKV